LLYSRAEYCFYPEDAFALEGNNQFNRVALVEQQTRIAVDKQAP
jgi:hypothetical protein